MRTKPRIGLLTCLLLWIFTASVMACCDPPCTGCKTCEAGVCVTDDDNCHTCKECISISSTHGECQYRNGYNCMTTSDCTGECESCVSCSCEDDPSKCTGECHNGCSGGNCVDDESKCPGECDTCDDGTCTDHDYECNWRLCETCNDGECEDRCPALGKYCNYDTGMCEVCVYNFHCELCEECIHHKCVHPCDDCVYPKYCGYACDCVECYYGEEEDTTTCSTTQSYTECDCSINIFNPCSSNEESVVYSGNSLKSCTGPDCDPVNVLCYTTYQTCRTSGDYQPLKWCGGDLVPPTCVLDLSAPVPGPGCWTCVNSFESGFPTYESQGDCPIEDWPE